MSKHDELKNTPPQGEPTVVDGEVLEESIDEKIARGRAYSQSKSSTGKAQRTRQGASLSSRLIQYRGYLLWSLLFAVTILTLLLTRPDNDWQIQHINDLQANVAQLKQTQHAIEKRIAQQEETLDKRMKAEIKSTQSTPDNTAFISQAELDRIQQQLQRRMVELQSSLTAIKENFSEQLISAVSGLDERLKSTEPLSAPSESPSNALQQLEEKFQTRLSDMTNQLAELVQFKTTQQMAADTTKPSLKAEDVLSPGQIQQWVVEINTQWMVNARAASTMKQLQALEQAVELSQLPDATTMGRLIGQDLVYLQQFKLTTTANALPNTDAIKQAMHALTLQNAATGAASPSKLPMNAVSSGEPINYDTALGQLGARFSEMFTLKKRQQSDETTRVDDLLQQDVLLQRGLLLIDRIDWAMQTRASEPLLIAVADVQQFIERHFSSHLAQFKNLLDPFLAVDFKSPEPLAIMAFKVGA